MSSATGRKAGVTGSESEGEGSERVLRGREPSSVPAYVRNVHAEARDSEGRPGTPQARFGGDDGRGVYAGNSRIGAGCGGRTGLRFISLDEKKRIGELNTNAHNYRSREKKVDLSY